MGVFGELVRYKQSHTLNASKCITDVIETKRKVAEQVRKSTEQKHLKRAQQFVGIGMIWDVETKCYVYSDDIHVSWEQVKDLPSEQFSAKFIELRDEIKEAVAAQQPTPPPATQPAQPLKAPIVQGNQRYGTSSPAPKLPKHLSLIHI